MAPGFLNGILRGFSWFWVLLITVLLVSLLKYPNILSSRSQLLVLLQKPDLIVGYSDALFLNRDPIIA